VTLAKVPQEICLECRAITNTVLPRFEYGGSLAESPARALNRARGHVRLYVSGLESVLEQVLRTVFHLLIQRKARVLRRPALPTRRGRRPSDTTRRGWDPPAA